MAIGSPLASPAAVQMSTGRVAMLRYPTVVMVAILRLFGGKQLDQRALDLLGRFEVLADHASLAAGAVQPGPVHLDDHSGARPGVVVEPVLDQPAMRDVERREGALPLLDQAAV